MTRDPSVVSRWFPRETGHKPCQSSREGVLLNIMNATLQSSELWAAVEQLKLTENMRLQRRGITEQEAEEIRRFADWLLDNNGHVTIPPYIRVISADDGLPALTAATYGEVWRNELLEADDEILAWFSKRALSAGKNKDVNAVNAEMLQKLPGESVCFRTADCIPRVKRPTIEVPKCRSNSSAVWSSRVFLCTRQSSRWVCQSC
jgi:hypothetical protein